MANGTIEVHGRIDISRGLRELLRVYSEYNNINILASGACGKLPRFHKQGYPKSTVLAESIILERVITRYLYSRI